MYKITLLMFYFILSLSLSLLHTHTQPHIVSVIEKAKIDNLRLSPSLDIAIQMVEGMKLFAIVTSFLCILLLFLKSQTL